MAVVGVLAHADVGHHDQLGARLLQRPDRVLNDAVLRVSLGPARVLRARDAEEKHSLQAERGEVTRLGGELVHRDLVDAGHRRHRLADALAGHDEQRVDEVGRVE